VSNDQLTARLRAAQAFQDALNAKAKKANKPPVMVGATDVIEVARLRTGSPGLDARLNGGWPVGSMVEIYGPYSSGKSTLAYATMVETMRRDPNAIVLLIDHEGSFDPERAARMSGFDPERFKKIIPEAIEDVVEIIEGVCEQVDEKGKSIFPLVIIDSLASIPTRTEMSGEIGDAMMADKARVMSRAIQRLGGKCIATGVTCLWVNQIRVKAGFSMGNPEYTPGGEALKYASWTRVQTRKDSSQKVLDEKGEVIGQVTKAKIEKNKGSGSLGLAYIQINHVNGLDAGFDIYTAGLAVGAVEKLPAAFYSMEIPGVGVIKEKGKDNFIAAVNAHEKRDEIYDHIVAVAKANKAALMANDGHLEPLVPELEVAPADGAAPADDLASAKVETAEDEA
jgi:recombination protein RecA